MPSLPFDTDNHAQNSRLSSRAISNSPEGYVPSLDPCPDDRPTIRRGTGLCRQETDWLLRRRNATITPMRNFLKRLAVRDFDVDKYFAKIANDSTVLPNIGIAISGGGYRGLLNGAGAVAAWDDREEGSTTNGNLGGLLQSATYISGSSSGSLLVGSLYVNNFTTVRESVVYSGVWQFGANILSGPNTVSLSSYYSDITRQVQAKENANFTTTLTDYWGRMLSFQMINDTNGGPGFTYSSIAQDTEFADAKVPVPILLATGRAPNEKISSTNSTIYEISPWELGSRDPKVAGHAPLEFVGSKFDGGVLVDNNTCVRGFDNAGFVMATSSSLFTQLVLYLRDKDSRYVPAGTPSAIFDAISRLLSTLGESWNDIADWAPNPFRNLNSKSTNATLSERLTLVDSSEDLQNIPFYPHLHPERNVDVVFAVDSSSDTESGWPDGVSVAATYARSATDSSGSSAFPAAPGKDTFLNLGLNRAPTFFGCDAANSTVNGNVAPLVVYLPNYPYVYASNISTLQLTVSDSERDAIVTNGWAVATQYNSTVDRKWPTCVACAILSRSLHRTNTPVPDACEACFKQYCWNGTLAPSKAAPYWPRFSGTPITNVNRNSADRLPIFASTAMLLVLISSILCVV